MGTLIYDNSGNPIIIEDRALSHLKIVMLTKLRRGESFSVSWKHPDNVPGGRSTIWVNPSIPIRFLFDEPEQTNINREWLSEMAETANALGGITLTEEHIQAEDPSASS